MGIRSFAAITTATMVSSLVFGSVVFAQSGQCNQLATRVERIEGQIVTIGTKNEAAIDKLIARGVARIAKMREKVALRQEALRAKIASLQAACATPTATPTATPAQTNPV